MIADVMKLPISTFSNADRAVAKGLDARQKLVACAARINACGQRIIEDCLAIGKELVAAREITRGAWENGTQVGEWRRFLEEDVKMARDQAKRFIDVYERYGTGVPRGTPLPDTSFRVLAELAAPEADKETVQAMESHLAQGGKVTVKEIVEKKQKAKREKVASAKTKKQKTTKPKRAPSQNEHQATAADFEDLKAMWRAATQQAKDRFREWLLEDGSS